MTLSYICEKVLILYFKMRMYDEEKEFIKDIAMYVMVFRCKCRSPHHGNHDQ